MKELALLVVFWASVISPGLYHSLIGNVLNNYDSVSLQEDYYNGDKMLATVNLSPVAPPAVRAAA